MTALRRSVRAILEDHNGDLVLFRRVRPGGTPYFVMPGGGVESEDNCERDTLRRELLEELGATARIGNHVGEIYDDQNNVSIFYHCKLMTMNPDNRSGEEFQRAQNGTYEIVHVRLDHILKPDFPLRPIEFKKLLDRKSGFVPVLKS